MPSLLHESLCLLFQNRPKLAPELLEILGVALPDYASARIESANFNNIIPAEYRADLVVLLVNGEPVFAIVVEVQLRIDTDKLFSWPAYVVGLRTRFKCPAAILVVAVDSTVVRWASQAIPLGPGFSFTPFVAGPSAVPTVTDPAVAAADPELAVLSAMAHGHGDPETAAKIGLAATSAIGQLSDPDRVVLYGDLILSALSEAARKALQMIPQGYEFQSPIIRDSIQKGRTEGEARGQARSVLDVLEIRGVPVSQTQQEKILCCTETEVLTTWLKRAVTVTSADELFTQ